MANTTKMAVRPVATFNLNGRVVPVQTIDEARSLWIALRDAEGLGSSDVVRGCGEYMEDGRVVAHVSYNGRMWQGAARAWNPSTVEIPATPRIVNRSDLYESGYDLPSYLVGP